MKMHRLIGAAVMAGLLTAGCGSVRAPEVELSAIRVAGIGLKGATLMAELDILNSNDFSIETDSITYQLFGNTSTDGTWQPLLQRTYAHRIVLPEDRRSRVEIPIQFDYSDLSGAARSILDRGTFNYRIQGQVFVREPMRRTMPFTKTGNVSLSGVR